MNDFKRIQRCRSFVLNLKTLTGGYTLVELMVTLAVVVGLTAVAVPSIRALVDDSSGNRAVREIISDLNVARAMAVRYNRNAQVDFDFAANKYTVTWNGGAQSREVDISGFRNGIQFTDAPPEPSPVAVVQVVFNPRGFAITSGNLYVTEDVSLTNPEVTRIQVSYAGAISEMRWNAAALQWFYK